MWRNEPSLEWSYEPIDVVVQSDGRTLDARIPARHPALVGRSRPTRGDHVCLGTEAGPQRAPRRRPDHRGLVTVIRRPEPPPSVPEKLHFTPQIPEAPKDPIGVPWSSLVPSVIGGLVIAMLFSPLFAILAGVTAAGLIGRSLASRYQYRRRTKKRVLALASATEEAARVRAGWTATEEARRREADLLVEAHLTVESMPWSKRLVEGRDPALHLGVGNILVAPEASQDTSEILQDAPELAVQAVAPALLMEVPIEIEISGSSGLAVCGDREPVLDLARSVLLRVLSEIGPADLGFVVFTTPDRLQDWDWLKWLPSLAGTAASAVEIQGLLEHVLPEDAELATSRPILVLVDGPEPSGPGWLARAFAGRAPLVRLLWLGESREIPAACVSQVAVRPDGSFVLSDLVGGRSQAGTAGRLSETEALARARSLAPFDDPELEEMTLSLPGRVSHESLYPGLAEAGSVESGSVMVGSWKMLLEQRWDKADRHCLTSVIGLDRAGPVTIDLVADGPHALAAGTTGSGKSELLRSLVVGAAINQPPDQVSFVLVDFKGGGAFDLVADLPHVAAVVTDLDPGEAGRALQSLQAEMKSREEVLRQHGCSDIADLSSGDIASVDLASSDLQEPVALPRLVIVVDEFASLAEELPEFLDGLIDIARRGRSLGVHLVLATQRPAGVVTGQIRANTNLRICLRVQDQADSMDVIEIADAARLPAVPGRAILRRGGTKPTTFQCVKVEPDQARELQPFVLHPGLLGHMPGPATGDEATDEAPISIEGLVAACKLLAPVGNEAPWLEPIGEVDLDEVTAELRELVAREVTGREVTGRDLAGERESREIAVALGWLDDPDHRARLPLAWFPERDGLAIIGSDGGQVEATASTAMAGLASQAPCHLYVLDGSGGRLRDLERLASVGSVVSTAEPERCLKTIRHITHQLEKQGQSPSSSSPTIGLLVHRWGAVVDALEPVGGPGAASGLQRLTRDGVDRGLALVVTGASDREIPGRVMAGLGQRLIHRLADPSGYLSFGLTSLARGGDRSGGAVLDGPSLVDPTSGLLGRAGRVDLELVREQPTASAPPSIRVLGDRVDRSELPPPVDGKRGLRVSLGLDGELDPVSVQLGVGRPILVLGRQGSGRTTAIETLVGTLPAEVAAGVVVIDDGEALSAEEARGLLNRAQEEGSILVVGATPATARGVGGWLAPLMADATIVLINPSRADGEACRTLVPDLAEAAPGRAVVLDGGRSTIIQIAA